LFRNVGCKGKKEETGKNLKEGAMNIVQRVKDIILKPKEAWQEIKTEPATVSQLFTSYAALLALIPPLAFFVGFNVLSASFGFYFGRGIGYAAVQYVLSLAGLYIFGLIIDALAPSFGSQKNKVNAMKVAVYSMTPYWVASLLYIIPSLALGGLVGLVSLYSIYLFYLGLPVLMETPQEKTLGYVIVVIVVSLIIFALIGAITGGIFGMGMRRWF
jgi:Yip1 domain